jgi:hypothetical protein
MAGKVENMKHLLIALLLAVICFAGCKYDNSITDHTEFVFCGVYIGTGGIAGTDNALYSQLCFEDGQSYVVRYSVETESINIPYVYGDTVSIYYNKKWEYFISQKGRGNR